MTISISGLSSALDRTLFTDLGPIVKAPLPILVGSNLEVFTNTDIRVNTGNFTTDLVGFQIQIQGSLGLRNDGIFEILNVLSSTQLRLGNVNLDTSDIDLTTNKLIALANDLKIKFNGHRTQAGIHGTPDTMNVVLAEDAVDLFSAIVLINDIRNEFAAHVIMTSGSPRVHTDPDLVDFPISDPATNTAGAILLVNELRQKFENHRTLNKIHVSPDFINRITSPVSSVVTNVFPGPLTGPFNWTIYDPRFGEVADDPSDVSVFVNSILVSVDAVFGLLGAVVLTTKPGPTDSVTINYNYIKNPPSRLVRLNSPEFNLNQAGNTAFSGYPSHRYKASSYLIDPSISGPELRSAFFPQKVSWKYKAFERGYSAVLNDPNTLLLNSPTNQITYPVLFTQVENFIVRYIPTTLPQNSSSPWDLEGVGTFSIDNSVLTIIDSDASIGINNQPPYFSHLFNFIAPSIVSAAFRVAVQDFVPHGCFSGVSFGISDGNRISLVGFIQTTATGLSSAITLVNSIKSNFNAHLIESGVHIPNDPTDSVIFIDAHDLQSLIILVNSIKSNFNSHLSKWGVPGVHQIFDSANNINLEDAKDLDTAIALVNAIFAAFTNHKISTGVHFVNDLINIVPLVLQAGFLTNKGLPEFQENWEAFSTNFLEMTTYRISRDSNGNVSLFLSGDVSPRIIVNTNDLPSIASLDGRFDAIQEIFFGSIEQEAKSTSLWSFVIGEISPLDGNLIGKNKFVSLSGLPETSSPPWIPIGQGGSEKVITGPDLLLDTMCSAQTQDISFLGLSSGCYRGFLRIEPIIQDTTSVVYEANVQVDFYTFSVDNRAAGFYVDDDDFTVQLSFIQFAPSPAVVTASKDEPYALISTDFFIVNIGSSNTTIHFSNGDNLSSIISKINTTLGFTFADNNLGRLRLISQDLGAEANFSIISGSALQKLGLSPGIYFGKDSNPEPRVSWFGDNLPDKDASPWQFSGGQSADLFSRILRISDNSSSDFRAYVQNNLLVTNESFNPSVNWKLNVRLAILSFNNPVEIPTSLPFLDLSFAGALISVDEGLLGKNIELQLSVDSGNNQYINIVSYNANTNTLDVKGQFAFAWNDGQFHNYNIFVNKSIDSIFILADGVVLSPVLGTLVPSYSGLNPGFSGPSITFGSGSAPIVGVDLSNCQSIVDWQFVSIFRDSKIADSTAALRRFIGLYKGGDPTLLSSYYLAQHDFSNLTNYRIIRDPINSVSVFINNNPTPSISVNYDSLTLPIVSSSFFRGISQNRSVIAFGSFNPQEISRTRWNSLQYSVGKLTLTNLLVPQHQILNQANVIVSPEHLHTDVPHGHFGFFVYSGGTPIDDFLSNDDVPAFTILGEGTPPVPMTQDLNSRGGLQKIVIPFDGVNTSSFINQQGFTSNYEDDLFNIVSANSPSNFTDAVNSLIDLSNIIQTNYNNHIPSIIYHTVGDSVNFSSVPPATDLPSSILVLNNVKAMFNAHLTQTGVHVPNDTEHTISMSDAVDLPTAVDLALIIIESFNGHINTGNFHNPNDIVNTLVSPGIGSLYITIGSLDEQRISFQAHAKNPTFHKSADLINGTILDSIPGLNYSLVQKDLVSGQFINIQQFALSVNIGDFIVFLSGPNVGDIVTISQILPTSFNVAPSAALVETFATNSTAKVPSIVAGAGNAGVNASLNVLVNISVTVLVGDVILFTNGPNVGKKQTITRIISPTIAIVGEIYPAIDSIGSSFNILRPNIGEIIIDLGRAFDVANRIKDSLDGHFIQSGIHYTNDVLDSVASIPYATNEASLITLTSATHDALQEHFIGNFIHLQSDSIDLIPSGIINPLNEAIVVANEILINFNQHLVTLNVHIEDDLLDTIQISEATGLASLIALLNIEKSVFNAHLTQTGVHVVDDLVNTITTPDAIDLSTALDLCIALQTAYNSHRVQSGVHGSSVFIRLDPPSRVEYNAMKFFTSTIGTPGLASPFSDDEY